MTDARPSSPAPRRLGFNPTGLISVVGMMVLFGLFFAAIGPFDTIDVPIGPRLAYWLTVMVLGGLIIKGVEYALARLLPIDNRVLRGLAVTLGTTPLQTLVVMTATATLFTRQPSAARYFDLLPAVLIITLVVVAVLELLRLSAKSPAGEASARPSLAEVQAADVQADIPAATPAMPPALARHLPARLRASSLIALKAEDHYVRVYTQAGSTLVLMRFSDAVAQAEAGLSGFRLHRSWWANKAALEGVSFKRGSGQAQLTGGLTAPVSRTYYPALREAGWF